MVIYCLLMPLSALNGAAVGYLSLLASLNHGWLAFCLLVLANVAPLWAFISRYSTNLLFDELLFNSILMGSYLATVSLLDNRNIFSALNWFGLFIAFAGFILMKLNQKERTRT